MKPNTTGTISGDLEKVRREHEAETALRLARLGPISKFAFELGRAILGLLPLALTLEMGFLFWTYIRIPFESEWLELIYRALGTLVVIGGVGSVVLKIQESALSRWIRLWLPPRS